MDLVERDWHGGRGGRRGAEASGRQRNDIGSNTSVLESTAICVILSSKSMSVIDCEKISGEREKPRHYQQGVWQSGDNMTREILDD